MRVTLNWLADQLKNALERVEIKDVESVRCIRSYNRSCDVEAGACVLLYRIKFKNSEFHLTMYGFYTCRQHEGYLNKGNKLKIIPNRRHRGTLMDAEFGF